MSRTVMTRQSLERSSAGRRKRGSSRIAVDESRQPKRRSQRLQIKQQTRAAAALQLATVAQEKARIENTSKVAANRIRRWWLSVRRTHIFLTNSIQSDATHSYYDTSRLKLEQANFIRDSDAASAKKQRDVLRLGGKLVLCPITYEAIPLRECFRMVLSPTIVVAYSARALAAYFLATVKFDCLVGRTPLDVILVRRLEKLALKLDVPRAGYLVSTFKTQKTLRKAIADRHADIAWLQFQCIENFDMVQFDLTAVLLYKRINKIAELSTTVLPHYCYTLTELGKLDYSEMASCIDAAVRRLEEWKTILPPDVNTSFVLVVVPIIAILKRLKDSLDPNYYGARGRAPVAAVGPVLATSVSFSSGGSAAAPAPAAPADNDVDTDEEDTDEDDSVASAEFDASVLASMDRMNEEFERRSSAEEAHLSSSQSATASTTSASLLSLM